MKTMNDISTYQLKDIIANMDADVAIVEKQYASIDAWLRDMGYFIPMKNIKVAVDELASDPYYQRMVA